MGLYSLVHSGWDTALNSLRDLQKAPQLIEKDKDHWGTTDERLCNTMAMAVISDVCCTRILAASTTVAPSFSDVFSVASHIHNCAASIEYLVS